jgi:hypothetical protein
MTTQVDTRTIPDPRMTPGYGMPVGTGGSPEMQLAMQKVQSVIDADNKLMSNKNDLT